MVLIRGGVGRQGLGLEQTTCSAKSVIAGLALRRLGRRQCAVSWTILKTLRGWDAGPVHGERSATARGKEEEERMISLPGSFLAAASDRGLRHMTRSDRSYVSR